MKHTEPMSLRQVLEEACISRELESELWHFRAAKLWPAIVGPALAQMTGKPFFRGNVMYIPVSRPALRNELTMMRSKLLSALNNALGRQVASDLRFTGPAPDNNNYNNLR